MKSYEIIALMEMLIIWTEFKVCLCPKKYCFDMRKGHTLDSIAPTFRVNGSSSDENNAS